MPPWLYIISAVSGSGSCGFALCYAVRAFFLIQGGRADNEQRSRQWFEAARLTRKDAKDLPSYLPDAAEAVKPPVRAAPPARRGQRRSRTRGRRRQTTS
jgi:hypothetical protein